MVGGARFDEVTDDAVHRSDHQVCIDRRGDPVLAQRSADHRADGQVRHIVVVHDIEMHDVGAGGQDIVHFLAQTGEVGGENRRSNSEGLHDAPFLSRITMARIVYLMLWSAHRNRDDQ